MSSLEPIGQEQLEGHSFLQSSYWAALKSQFGWVPRAFLYDGSSVLILVRFFGVGFALAYVPHGPKLNEEHRTAEFLSDMGEALRRFLPRQTLCIRFDLPWTKYGSLPLQHQGESAPLNLVKAPVDIQPPSTVLLDLEKSEDNLLQEMKTKTRYNIKVAARRGIKVAIENEAGLRQWYDLYRETAKRDCIAIHSRDYYYSFFSTARDWDPEELQIKLFLARKDGDLCAGNIMAFYRDTAIYLFGASAGQYRRDMPTYALQWEAIRYARALGCKIYDFYGIPPAADPQHPMYGLYRFKTGFGGTIVHRPGCWDVPLRRHGYALYRFAETGRDYFYKKIKKR